MKNFIVGLLALMAIILVVVGVCFAFNVVLAVVLSALAFVVTFGPTIVGVVLLGGIVVLVVYHLGSAITGASNGKRKKDK